MRDNTCRRGRGKRKHLSLYDPATATVGGDAMQSVDSSIYKSLMFPVVPYRGNILLHTLFIFSCNALGYDRYGNDKSIIATPNAFSESID